MSEVIKNKTKKVRYEMNDLNSVYTHYNATTGKNEPTENKLIGDEKNAKSSK